MRILDMLLEMVEGHFHYSSNILGKRNMDKNNYLARYPSPSSAACPPSFSFAFHQL